MLGHTVRRCSLLLPLSIAAALPAAAQTIVISDRVDAASVTLYPDRGRNGRAIDSSWPGGYALITETRTISLPAGRAILRFEGVAEGMLPETAIVTGLPRGVREKNRDLRLLSPAGLIDAYLKRSVTVTRTSRATGKVSVEDAIIQAGPGGGVVLTTAEGVEALGCSGLPEALSYPSVPDDLFARPTLSVVTESVAPATATIQLSYLSQGFDWSANYVASIADDGKTLDLFAWMTVANGGSQGFSGARTQAIAGAPNTEGSRSQPEGPTPELHLQCWPMDITSTHDRWAIAKPPPPPSPDFVVGEYSDIVVTGTRFRAMAMATPVAVAVVMVATQEELGDLKLYRIPEPVTVAARSRKQVAMIDRRKIRFDRIYTARFDDFDYNEHDAGLESSPSDLVLRTENRERKGLGLPLPGGSVALFEKAGGAPLLIYESQLDDRAIGEDVELQAGASSDVRYRIVARPPAEGLRPFAIRVTNARDKPQRFEFMIPYPVVSASEKLVEQKGSRMWRVTVPADGEAKLDFALKLEVER